MSNYAEFLARKRQSLRDSGVSAARGDFPSRMFDWQKSVTAHALQKGRFALFEDCGLGKTIQELAWADKIPGRVLIAAPLCVAEQTVREAALIGLDLAYATSGPSAGGARLVITNYERIDAFNADHFDGIVLDESSILKSFDGKTRTRLIAKFKDTPYRLCATATPSPNDIAELANHAEFLGLCTRAEFLARWFVHDSSKGWRLKGHAREPFYRWLATWAVALRTPADIGYPDDGYVLPKLDIIDHVVEGGDAGGVLFPELGLKGITGRLKARRASVESRVEAAAALDDGEQWIYWCGINDEANAITKAIKGAVNVEGKDSYERKRASILGFVSGEHRVLVTKAKIAGFGMNFQHCARMAFVGLGDSYEQYYQMIRRCWRFGQKRPVEAHIIISNAERAVVSNVRRKQWESQEMTSQIIAHMRDSIERNSHHEHTVPLRRATMRKTAMLGRGSV